MDSYNRIKKAVQTGMSEACSDMNNFCNQPEPKFNAEYLFTVAAAHAISDLNGPPADPYHIKIEHSTKTLQRDCLKPFLNVANTTTGLRSTIARHKYPIPSVSRNGRVDIAVYADIAPSNYLGEKPLCIIELKGFNPNKRLVLEDVGRNLELHRLSGATGPSVLEFSFFAALHSSTPEQSNAALEQKRTWYSDLLKQLGDINDFILEIDTFTVSLDAKGRLEEELHDIVLNSSTIHHYIGVIVGIRKHI
jgi:hypothetical protein